MGQRRKKFICSLLSSILICGVANVAVAEEAEEVFDLEEVVVTANRMPTKRSETAAAVTVVNRDEFEKKELKTVTEALLQAGVQVEAEGGGGSISRIMLNGSEQVVVLVDGRRVSWEQQSGAMKGNTNAGVLPDLDSIERIEVVRGAASSLYGSAGVGGVVNIITREGNQNEITAASEFGSWDSRRYNLRIGGTQDGTAYMVAAEKHTQGDYDYKDPFTGRVVTMPNSGFSLKKASVRIDREIGRDKILTFYFDHFSENVNTPMAPPGMYYQGASLHRPDSFRQSVQNNVSLAYQWQQGDDITNQFQVYRNHYSRYWYGHKPDGSSSRQYNEADGISWNQTRRINDRHTLLGGFDWRNSHVDMPHFELTKNEFRTLGLFLEDRWAFDRNWLLNTGVRWDDASTYDSKSTVRVSVNRKVDSDTNVYLSWGQVYRGPDIDMMFMPAASYFKGNPNLRPETGHVTTLGINTKLKGGTVVQANVFSSYLKDAMKWNWNHGVGLYEAINIAQQKRRGLDIALTHPLDAHWGLTAGYSYVRTKENQQDDRGYAADIANSSPNAYRLGLLYNNDDWNVHILGRGASGRSLEAFSSKQYWVVDVAANYQMTPEIKLYAKVYNLTNRAYETTYIDYGVGSQPMSARQFVFGVEGRL